MWYTALHCGSLFSQGWPCWLVSAKTFRHGSDSAMQKPCVLDLLPQVSTALLKVHQVCGPPDVPQFRHSRSPQETIDGQRHPSHPRSLVMSRESISRMVSLLNKYFSHIEIKAHVVWPIVWPLPEDPHFPTFLLAPPLPPNSSPFCYIPLTYFPRSALPLHILY